MGWQKRDRLFQGGQDCHDWMIVMLFNITPILRLTNFKGLKRLKIARKG
jgi:hypothetical protein